jgi:hypothetical protein
MREVQRHAPEKKNGNDNPSPSGRELG